MSLLEVNNLVKKYNDRIVVNGFSLSIDKGEIVGLLGPNGAGKTTAFYMIMGLIKADRGNILFNHEDISSLPINERANLGLGYLAQEPSIFRGLTVAQNILSILESLPLSKQERLKQLETLLEQFHLSHLKDKSALVLSGGERRRLEIARTLVKEPKLILLDEPFAAVDPVIISELKKILIHLKEKGISFLITDHNVREIFSIADRSYLVQHGTITHSGKANELMQDPDVIRSYLGSDFRY